MRKLILIAAAGLAACGDPDTNDQRGYTKAPLENATVLVQGEPESVMDNLGNPNLPIAPLIEAEAEPEPAGDGGDQQQQQAGPPPAGATAADVTAGEQIFAQTGNCFTCHGAAGAGTGMGPQLNDTEWLNIDGSYASIQQVINNGVSTPKQFPAAMPAKGGAALTEQQVKQVAAYVYSISR